MPRDKGQFNFQWFRDDVQELHGFLEEIPSSSKEKGLNLLNPKKGTKKSGQNLFTSMISKNIS